MERPTEIGASTVIRGEISSREDIVISGRVEGTIQSEGHRVTVNAGADVTADILAHDIVVAGKVVGALSAKQRIALSATADVDGELSAPAITLGDGASFRGKVETTGERKAKLQLAS